MLETLSVLCAATTVGTDLTSKCFHHDTGMCRSSPFMGNFKLGIPIFYLLQSLMFLICPDVMKARLEAGAG